MISDSVPTTWVKAANPRSEYLRPKDFENPYQKKSAKKNRSKSENHEKISFFKISQIINTIDFWCPPGSDF